MPGERIGLLFPGRPMMLLAAVGAIGAAALAGVVYSAWISLRGGKT